MLIERVNRPTGGAVSIDRAKVHCRVDLNDSDVQIADMTAAATRELEDFAGLALQTQAIRVTPECWPRATVFPLPIAPVLDILTVSVTADGEAFGAYAVIGWQRPALRLTGERPSGLVVIDCEAGFGDMPGDIPADPGMAVLDQVAILYDMRGVTDPRQGTCLSPHMARTAARYRRVAL